MTIWGWVAIGILAFFVWRLWREIRRHRLAFAEVLQEFNRLRARFPQPIAYGDDD